MQKLRKYFLTANRFDDMFHCSRAFYISPPIREKWGHSDITRLFEGGGLRRPVSKKKDPTKSVTRKKRIQNSTILRDVIFK